MPPRSSNTSQRLGRFAWFLDSAIPIPGTRFRIGLDGLIGLIPGVGDAVGAALSSYLLAEAVRLGVPISTVLRMGLNILVEALIGLIPFVGDIFDFAWKANLRNVRLLNAYIDNPRKTARSSRVVVTAIIVGIIVLLILLIYLAFLVLRALVEAVSG